MLRPDLLWWEPGVIEVQARGAWRELEARLRPYVARRVASPSDVDDLVQDVLARVFRGVDELRDGQSFGGWVYRIARHRIVDHQRSAARARGTGREADDSFMDDAAGDVEKLESELAECVALFVARLPSPYREAITLTELQGLTQADAAELTGVSLSGMKSRVQRGRERLRRMFEECCEISLDVRGRVTECSPRSSAEPPAALSPGSTRRECRAGARDGLLSPELWRQRRGDPRAP